jgi:NADH-quinone oxidoreductase subunit M
VPLFLIYFSSTIIIYHECISNINYTFGWFATFLAGDKLASKVALFFGLAAAGASIVLLNHYNLGEISSSTSGSQPNISFALKADGLSMAMLLLTTVLTQ